MDDFSAFSHLVSQRDNCPWLVRFDLPGFGASPVPSVPMGSDGYGISIARAISQIVVEMGGSPQVVVIGHSFGGRVALALSGLDLDFALKGMVISGVPLFRPEPSVRKLKLSYRMLRLLFKAGVLSSSKMEQVRGRYGSADYRSVSGVMREVFVKVVNEDYASLIREANVPITLFWGTSDGSAPLGNAYRAVELCPEMVELLEVPGDHFVAVNSPMQFLEAVDHLGKRT